MGLRLTCTSDKRLSEPDHRYSHYPADLGHRGRADIPVSRRRTRRSTAQLPLAVWTDLFDGDCGLPGFLFVEDGETDRSGGVDVRVEEGWVEFAYHPESVSFWTTAGVAMYTSVAL